MIDRASEATTGGTSSGTSSGTTDGASAALQRLQRAIDERGIAARVEERAALAIIVPCGVSAAGDVVLPHDANARPAAVTGGGPRASATSPGSSTSAPSPSALAFDADTRGWLVQAALAAGYSHVALEVVPPDASDAALPGRHPA